MGRQDLHRVGTMCSKHPTHAMLDPVFKQTKFDNAKAEQLTAGPVCQGVKEQGGTHLASSASDREEPGSVEFLVGYEFAP